MLIEKKCAELAALVGGRVIGECPHVLQGVAALKEARPTDVAFLGHDKYRDQVLPSQAGVVLVPADYDTPPPDGRAWIACAAPSQAFGAVIAVFTPPPVSYPAGIHPSAVLAEGVAVDPTAHIGPGCVLAAGARVGAGSILVAQVYVGNESCVGACCLLYPGVVVRERCLLGNRVILHAGVVIGADGFGYDSGPAGHQKIPQVGMVQIDDEVEIGANSCVDRARFGRTWIQRGTKIDNLVQIGHNTEIGEAGMIVAQVGISGSCILGKGVILAGQAGLAGHLRIGDGAIVMGQAGVSKDLAPGAVVIGSPAMDRREFARQMLYLSRVDQISAAVKALQSELAALKQAGSPATGAE